jgi:class 3 adenylate cyclase
LTSKDVFENESQVLAEAKALAESSSSTEQDFSNLVGAYGKLLKTTKRIIKLSDKNEQRLNILKEEAQETNKQLEGMSSQLSKFLSPQLYQSIFSGSRQGSRVSRRKKLTVFFSDLCGFTNFVESMESEDVTDLLNLYLETMTTIALEYGATIDKYIGDGIMLFFGDPETDGIEADAIKCVKMALDMLKELDNLSDRWERYGLKEPLQMRIGIDTGFATVGNFGSESRLDYTAIGSAVNRASRLEEAADNGSIYISQDTYALVKGAIDAEQLPKIELKGLGLLTPYKVLKSVDSTILNIEAGQRSMGVILDKLAPDELERTRNSLKLALKAIDDFDSKQSQLPFE